MKKSLIALAVLAASGASFAQSTVSIYGIADVWFGSTKTDNGTTSLTQTKLDSGGVDTSRWGLKGSEDLGGGLKANFKFEQGFTLDNGAVKAGSGTNTTGFTRYAYVGVSGGFGEVKLGVTGTAYDDVSGASDAVFDSALSPMGNVFKNAYTWNPSNTIYYATPTFAGFAGAVSYSLGEDKNTAVSASSITAMNVTYTTGPLAVQLGYQVEDIQNTVALPQDASFLRLGGSYNFGVATLKANYGKDKNVGNVADYDATDYQIGVDFPVSSALTVSANYAHSTDSKTGGAFESTRKGYGIGAAYTLSKRTYVYGGYEADTYTQAAGSDGKNALLAVGINHKF